MSKFVEIAATDGKKHYVNTDYIVEMVPNKHRVEDFVDIVIYRGLNENGSTFELEYKGAIHELLKLIAQ